MKTLFTVPDDALAVQYGISGPVWLDKSGIIITVNTGELAHTLEHAKSQIAAFDKIFRGVQRPMIVDFTLVKSITRDAREFYANEENSGKLKAMAIVTASSIGQLVGNFVLRVNGSRIPSRIFTDAGEAKSWIQQYV